MKTFIGQTFRHVLLAGSLLTATAAFAADAPAEAGFIERTLSSVQALFTSDEPTAETAPVEGSEAIVPAGTDAETAIRSAFAQSRPDVTIDSVAASEVAGLYRVSLKNGPSVYATADGKFFLLGDLFQVGKNGFENIAERERNIERKALMAAVSKDDMIVFSPAGEVKGSVYVFTDVDCGYCQKLHKEVPKLNKLGIEVRYLAYPRAGVNSPTGAKMVSAWCADDKKAALTALKNRKAIASKSCKNSPVAAEYLLGGKVGVTGTPAIVTSEGRLIPGYMPADRLAVIAIN